jgi:hypothetical protein
MLIHMIKNDNQTMLPMKTHNFDDVRCFDVRSVKKQIPLSSRSGHCQKPFSTKASWALLAAVLFSISLTALPAQAQNRPVKYSNVRVHITSQSDLLPLAEAGLAVDHIDFQGSYFDVVLNDNEVSILRSTGRRYNVLVDDMEAAYQKRPKLSATELNTLQGQMSALYATPSHFHLGSMGGFLTLDEVALDLDAMLASFPNLITIRRSIGNSFEGREIWMVKISDNPDADEDETEVLYTGLHHAREPQSMTTLIYFMWYLLENYGVDQAVKDLVDSRELYFVPVVNPDGYAYNQQTNPNGGGLWRKNRRNNGNGTYGVDLNRNYGYGWGYDNTGSSPTPSSETYRGAAGFSEPETQAIRNFAINRQFTTAINFHAHGNWWIFPWAYKANIYTPDHPLFLAWCQDLTQFNHYGYGTPIQTVGYLVNGGSDDWFYGDQVNKAKVYSFTPEVGSSSDGFWPTPDRIIPLAAENVYPNLVSAAGWSGPIPTISLPASPANSLTASAPPRSGVRLAWADNSNNEEFFEVQRRTGTAAWVVVATLNRNATSYQDTTTAARTSYTYRVYASNFAGNSPTSNQVTIKAR